MLKLLNNFSKLALILKGELFFRHISYNVGNGQLKITKPLNIDTQIGLASKTGHLRHVRCLGDILFVRLILLPNKVVFPFSLPAVGTLAQIDRCRIMHIRLRKARHRSRVILYRFFKGVSCQDLYLSQ